MVSYLQVDPTPALADYIDAFWTVTSEVQETISQKILPDGCVDIILNLGEDCRTEDGAIFMRNEKAYLIGTMNQYKITAISPGVKMLGIRFKPGAYSAFYDVAMLDGMTDKTAELDTVLSMDLRKLITDPVPYLNKYFGSRLKHPANELLSVIADIKQHQGQIKVADLVARHPVTARQLERKFKTNIGMAPKELINLIRFQCVWPIIQNRPADKSLLEVAFENGYYDHAHLTNQIKRYTGLAPAQL